MDKVRYIALKLIKDITQKGAFSAIELDKALSSNKDLTNLDKAFITELVYGTVDKLWTLDRIIESYSKISLEKMEDWVLSSLRLALYQIKYMDKVPPYAAINEAVDQVKRETKAGGPFVNGILRSILRGEKKLTFKNKIEKLSFDYSMPLWISEKINEDYPKNIKGILSALSKTKGISLRVNILKISLEDYKKLLDENNISYKSGKIIDSILYVEGAGDIKELPGYREGYFSIQNESASLISYILYKYISEKVKGEGEGKISILDLCSAPGGKSSFLYELSKGKYHIKALDLSPKRVALMEGNFKRLGQTKIESRIWDGTIIKDEYREAFAGIIADVPCSGLGIMGRKPDIKINMTRETMAELIPLQRILLENAAAYVEKGGYIIYSTCTLNRDENERNITNFLKNKSDEFEIVELDFLNRGNIGNNSGMYTIFPDDTMDGFFFCLLRKNKSSI